MSKNNLSISYCYCTQCGTRFPIPRKKSRKREAGHLKKLYCYTCKKEQNFVECNDIAYSYDDFIQEFSNNGFSAEGLRS